MAQRQTHPGRKTALAILLSGAFIGLSLAYGEYITPGAAYAAFADCEGGPVLIDVHVENLRSDSGLVTGAIYDDNPRNFLAGGRKISRSRVVPQNGAATLCLHAPRQGNYAIFVYHDENANRKYDLSFFGRPKEGVGFSNNPTLRGLPDLGEVLFPVDSNESEISVVLTYP